RGRSPPHYVREDPKEEGELQDTGSANKGFQTEGKTSTSNNPQHESNGAKVNLVKVPLKPLGLENGAKAVIASETVGAGEEMAPPLVDIGKDNTGNEVMDLEETGNPIAGDEGVMCEDDDFQNLTDGEMEDLNGSQEVVRVTTKGNRREGTTSRGGGEEEGCSQATTQANYGCGNFKEEEVQALLSQNINVQARQGKRQGEGIRLQEEKGSSHPKQTSSKNSTASHERYEGDMESMASWFVGMRSSYLIQWMMDLISLNQAQWKNGIRMVLDKVRLISIIIWYKEVLSYSYVDITKRTVARRWVSLVIGLRWSLIMGGGARFGVMGLCWIIVEEHTLGLVSLNQVQRIYGTMKCISCKMGVVTSDLQCFII
ncbi:hypothetical protein HID58_067321, partial [Brassica napus]